MTKCLRQKVSNYWAGQNIILKTVLISYISDIKVLPLIELQLTLHKEGNQIKVKCATTRTNTLSLKNFLLFSFVYYLKKSFESYASWKHIIILIPFQLHVQPLIFRLKNTHIMYIYGKVFLRVKFLRCFLKVYDNISLLMVVFFLSKNTFMQTWHEPWSLFLHKFSYSIRHKLVVRHM